MRLVHAAALALGLAGAVAAAQVPRFEARTAMVTVTATAQDKQGRTVRNLRPEEVQVLENGRRQRLTHFSTNEEGVARLLLLVDGSGSMTGDKPARARLAFLRILDGLRPRDEAALASFDEDYRMHVAFTSDRRRLLEAFDALPHFGTTALFDALAAASGDLAASGGEGRRAIVALTDGIDNASRRSSADAMADARTAPSPLFALSVLSPLEDPDSGIFVKPGTEGPGTLGRKGLVAWSEASGGEAFLASDLPGVETAVTQILGQVRHQYRLGYDPPPGPPGFRRIEVRSTRRGVVMRARRGYLARS